MAKNQPATEPQIQPGNHIHTPCRRLQLQQDRNTSAEHSSPIQNNVKKSKSHMGGQNAEKKLQNPTKERQERRRTEHLPFQIHAEKRNEKYQQKNAHKSELNSCITHKLVRHETSKTTEKMKQPCCGPFVTLVDCRKGKEWSIRDPF